MMTFDLDKAHRELNNFLLQYERATNSHDFNQVKPLIDTKATYHFTDGNYKGLKQIKEAFENTWKKIAKEKYYISNIRWVATSATVAACYYDFKWNGLVAGKRKSGKGGGTNIIVKHGGKWFVKHEHLSN